MGNGRDWAIESFRIASREIYGKISGPGGTDAPIILSSDYPMVESATVRQQRKGGRAVGLGSERNVALKWVAPFGERHRKAKFAMGLRRAITC
jgi:hypothetical protein